MHAPTRGGVYASDSCAEHAALYRCAHPRASDASIRTSVALDTIAECNAKNDASASVCTETRAVHASFEHKCAAMRHFTALRQRIACEEHVSFAPPLVDDDSSHDDERDAICTPLYEDSAHSQRGTVSSDARNVASAARTQSPVRASTNTDARVNRKCVPVHDTQQTAVALATLHQIHAARDSYEQYCALANALNNPTLLKALHTIRKTLGDVPGRST